MAQYYQVLSQESKSEEIQQFYENIDENPTVQYVITTDGGQQQFQTQPVVLSTDQVMVVEGQGQQVIIDQTQVSYQPSYVIQDNRPQQVFYMANAAPSQQIVVEQPIAQPPVVLNHQLMPNQLTKVTVATPLLSQAAPLNAVVQEKGIVQMQRGQLKAQTRGLPGTPQKIIAQGLPQEVLSFQRKTFIEKETGEEEEEDGLASVPGGRNLMSFQQYRKVVLQQKQNPGLHDKPSPSMPQRKPGGGVGGGRNSHGRNPTKKQSRANRSNTFVPSSSVEEPVKQPVQYQNNLTPRLHRPLDNRNQYLIQPPRTRDKQAPRPLPQFLHSAQIENIIANTPLSDEYSDSIRMLVLLDNGEQRLITFTLPKEACTIQEILEQVNVPFNKDTPIQVSEANANGLNYIVAVGNVPGFSMEAQILEELPTPDSTDGHTQQSVTESESPGSKSSSPEPAKDNIPPRLVEGQLAVCTNCGYLSEDFNRCMRCRRQLPDNVKAIPAPGPGNNKKLDHRILINDKRIGLAKANGIPRINLLPKKRPSRPKLLECETVVVSSDEEDDSDKKTPVKNVNERLLEKLGASVTISPISKEPSNVDIQKTSILAATKGSDKIPADQINSTLVLCRTVRIGSYRFVPPEPIRIDSNGLVLKVPHPKSENTIQVIRVDTSDMVKVLISFQKSLPVIFYYLVPSVGVAVRAALDMVEGGDFYFDPLSETEEPYRRITLLPEVLSDDSKQTLQKIYSKGLLLDELTYKEANDILIKTCPKELSKSVLNYSVSEIKPILMYPPEGRGRITINTEDYMCLGQDQFLNDVIIDFYLKYLVLNLPKEQQEKVHVFSTFFYKRLTTKPLRASRKSQPAELDPNLSPAEKRHTRVKTWTKNVNIFDKDFIVVPINENCHWFLAIICFPNMNGCHTMDGQPIKIETRTTRKKKEALAAKEKKVESPPIMCEDPDLSDKDEAEGDDSELESDGSEEIPPIADPILAVSSSSNRPAIRQPCILIFDSLAGTSRSRVVATLRDYLSCEYKAKMDVEKMFTKDVIKGHCPKVPQQTNFTDCGLYLLQYVEQFFEEPIKDYYIPISHLKEWFEELTVTRKREDISLLIKSLMKQYGRDLDLVPDVAFPTLNGELTERAIFEAEKKFVDPDEEEEMMDEDEEEEWLLAQRRIGVRRVVEKNYEFPSETTLDSPMKPSSESVKGKNDFEQIVTNPTLLKPDISELPKQTSKDTLSYLKAKRIIRHKNNSDGGPDSKKIKSADTSDA